MESIESIKKMNKFYKIILSTILFLFLVGIVAAGTVLDSNSISGLFNLESTNINGVNFTDSLNEPYSYFIYTDGTTIYAKNGNTGKIDYSGLYWIPVIQSAINMAGNNAVIYTRGDMSLNSSANSIKIYNNDVTLTMHGTITTNTTVIQIGSNTERPERPYINFDKINCIDISCDAIKIENGLRPQITFKKISNNNSLLGTGINISLTSSSAWVNGPTIYGDAINGFNKNVVYDTLDSSGNIEAGRYNVGLNSYSNYGLFLNGSVNYNLFMGAIDNILVANSSDINVNSTDVSKNCFDMVFVRTGSSTFGLDNQIRTIRQAETRYNGIDGIQIKYYNGGINLWRSDGVPYVDFSDVQTVDYQARFKMTSDYGLRIVVNATGTTRRIDITPDGTISGAKGFILPTILSTTPTTVGSIRYDSTSKTTHCYDGSTWRYCGNGTVV